MRNKPFSYRLSGWLLLAGLAMVRPCAAEGCNDNGCTKEVNVTYKASFVTPSCNVAVPPEVKLPEAVISDFAAGGRLNALTPLNGSEYFADLYTNFDVTLSQCDATVSDTSAWKYLRLTFTDLGNTSSEAGIFAADYPPRDDVGFVIFALDNANLNVLLDQTYYNPGTPDTDLTYHFKVRMQKYSSYTGAVAPGQVSGSVSVVATYE